MVTRITVEGRDAQNCFRCLSATDMILVKIMDDAIHVLNERIPTGCKCHLVCGVLAWSVSFGEYKWAALNLVQASILIEGLFYGHKATKDRMNGVNNG